MEEEEGGMLRKKKIGAGEVDYKEKSGTAWSHSYLNQKPWHPLSYPNQRRKWIAEQTDAQRQRRAEEVAREFAQEQEFFRQTALISQKEKEKVEMMKAVSFMYVRPPGYNAESAKAAELEDERKQINSPPQPQQSMPQESSLPAREKKKQRPKDVFGRSLPTEEEFGVLKNAPRMETGLPARAKPFGVEIRNVKCARCGAFGHQSGDRECPLKDAIMPSEQSRLQRDDPLTSILAHTESSEPLKWELKQKPGISPPRGGFKPDDPNQQIVAEEIFDEYGGFLGGGGIPELLTSFSLKKSRKHLKSKTKHKHQLSPFDSDAEREKGLKKAKTKREKHKMQKHSDSPDHSDFSRHRESRTRLSIFSSSGNADKDGLLSRSDSDTDRVKRLEKGNLKREKHKQPNRFDSSDDLDKHRESRRWPSTVRSSEYSDKEKHKKQNHSDSSDDSDLNKHRESRKRPPTLRSSDYSDKEKHKKWNHSDSSDDSDFSKHRESRRRPPTLRSSDYSDKEKHKKRNHSDSSDDSDFSKHRESRRPPSTLKSSDYSEKEKYKKRNHFDSSGDSDFSRHRKSRRRPSTLRSSDRSDKDASSEKRSKKERLKRERHKKRSRSGSSDDSSDFNRHDKSKRRPST